MNDIKEKETYNQAIKDVLEVFNTPTISCLCGHSDPYDGSCMRNKPDYRELIKKLLK